MMVEDHPHMCRLLTQLLSDVADSIVECADGEQAVAAYAVEQPDWTLMDLHMERLAASRRPDGFGPPGRRRGSSSSPSTTMSVGGPPRDRRARAATFSKTTCWRCGAGCQHRSDRAAMPMTSSGRHTSPEYPWNSPNGHGIGPCAITCAASSRACRRQRGSASMRSMPSAAKATLPAVD